MTNNDNNETENNLGTKVVNDHSKTVKKLMLVVLAMFGFGFALVPLYDVFCDITGLNGKTNNSAAAYSTNGVMSRVLSKFNLSHATLRVFLGNLNP